MTFDLIILIRNGKKILYNGVYVNEFMGYLEEQQHLKKIQDYLDQMSVPYKLHDIGDKQGEKFPALICTYRSHELDFDVIIYNLGHWIHVKCMVMNTINLSAQTRLPIFELCLELNYDLPECTFSAYKKNIFIEIDCLQDVDFDDFSAEFHSIGDGIEAFIENISDFHQVEIKSTKGQLSQENSGRPNN